MIGHLIIQSGFVMFLFMGLFEIWRNYKIRKPPQLTNRGGFMPGIYTAVADDFKSGEYLEIGVAAANAEDAQDALNRFEQSYASGGSQSNAIQATKDFVVGPMIERLRDQDDNYPHETYTGNDQMITADAADLLFANPGTVLKLGGRQTRRTR